MPLIPDKKIEKVQFFENRMSLWTTNAVAIGTTSTDVTAMGTLTTAARAAYNAQQIALDAAKAATETFNNAVDAMGVKGAGIIKQVRTKADVTNNPAVYTMANIPAPATPQPRGTPGTPTDFSATLHQDGSVELGWKCTNTGGVMYQVYRSITGSAGTFAYVGGTGERKITDSTIPVGTSHLTYKIQAVRSTAAGLWGTFNVGFGTGTIEPGVTYAPVKLAA